MIDAIYTRQSVDRADSISIESQMEFCQYETRGGEYRYYSDRGFSGKNTDRPDFQRMMNDIKNGEIKRVIVYKLDRISRSRRFLLRSAGQRQRAASSARSLRQARTGKSSPRFRQANTRSLLRVQKGLTCRSRRQSSSQAVGAPI